LLVYKKYFFYIEKTFFGGYGGYNARER